MADRALVAGVDSSTQSTKVELRERDSGQLVDQVSASHTHSCWDPPVSEQDPQTWWDALADCFAQLADSDRADVVAVSVAGQQHGLVLVGEDGAVLRPAKLWNDTTSAPQARDLVARHAPERWAQRCGSVPLASFTIAKLAWVLEHESEVASQIAKIMLPHDWLTWRLSGAHVSDRGDASGTGWFDPAGNETAVDLLGLVVERLRTAGCLEAAPGARSLIGPAGPDHTASGGRAGIGRLSARRPRYRRQHGSGPRTRV